MICQQQLEMERLYNDLLKSLKDKVLKLVDHRLMADNQFLFDSIAV